MQALFGQRLSSDINLAAQLLILVGLWVGFGFARRKRIDQHQAIQTSMVLVNSFFIIFVMATSFYNYVIAGGTTTGTVATLMMLHGLLGLLAELTGIYLILRMSTKLLPNGLRVRNFRAVMRTLLGLWTVLVVLGLGIYYYRYLAPRLAPAAAGAGALQLLVIAADDLQIHADEMAQAADRGNLETAKRHAEHLINLVAGKGGAGYGDADHNGIVEDPGNGTGFLTVLEGARAEAKTQGADTAAAEALLGQMQDASRRLQADAQAVIAANDLSGITQPIEEAAGLANLLRDPQSGLIAQFAQGMHIASARPTAVVQANSGGGAATVSMDNFVFSPKSLQVKKGTTVVFVNHDSAKHTVTSDTGKFDSGDIDPGGTYQFQFNEAGQFPYYCRFHGDKGGVDMAGVIVVTP